jgi:tectonin beta-propeller repeat-containing protein 1
VTWCDASVNTRSNMPSSLLFGINNEGRVHTLSTTGSMWREIPYGGQEFKKLSAVPYFLWALGGDHQIYVYVHGLDIPIRVREEAYENEVIQTERLVAFG